MLVGLGIVEEKNQQQRRKKTYSVISIMQIIVYMSQMKNNSRYLNRNMNIESIDEMILL